MRYNVNDMEELICENQFKSCTLSDWGRSDIGIDLGKSILINHYLIGDNQILELIWKITSGRVIYLIGDNQILELIWETSRVFYLIWDNQILGLIWENQFR